MKKIKCLVTAGPTREYFDPVRFISNPSSGKMGWNIARAASEAGWETSLVLGPSQLGDIEGVENRIGDGVGKESHEEPDRLLSFEKKRKGNLEDKG